MTSTVDVLTDAIELVMDEFQAWDYDGLIFIEVRFGMAEANALRNLREAYESVHGQPQETDGQSPLVEAVYDLLDRIADLGIDTSGTSPFAYDEMGDCGRAAWEVRNLLPDVGKASQEGAGHR